MVKGLLVLAAAAAFSGSAQAAATPAPKMAEIVTVIATHPTSIVCDADVNKSPFPAASGATITAWTYTGGNVIHALQAICDETYASVGSVQFADGLATMIHEAARARGLTQDSCVELYADLGVYDMLREFFGVPFFSRESERVGGQVLALTRARPASYQPETCWSSGSMR